jgi:two-component system, OmpR family, sensor kinase
MRATMSSMATWWARTPLRIKLTLAFTGVMAILLVIASVTLSLLSAANLDRAIDDGLEARAGDAAALVREGAESGRLSGSGEALAQVLDSHGNVLDTTPGAGTEPLLTPSELRRAMAGGVVTERGPRLGLTDGVRVLGRPAPTDGGEVVIVVGESLEQRTRALEGLHTLLAIGGPLALLVASLAGYAVAAAALRPVERMRRRAAELTGEAEGRLPVPPSRDEIARLGNTLNAMLGRLQAVLARERSFVSDASHELRTPLAILRTELELALRGRSTREELEEAVRSAAEETERLNQLADDLLVIARSDQGRLPVRPAEIEARALLESVAHRFAARARAEQRTLLAEPADGLTLTADRARLEQALANMVDNALRHGAGDVVLSAARDDGLVELHVRDRGPGFPDDFLPSAFERFSRADEARSRGGTGLGLAITSAVAKAHGGEAHASNREEGGADVWLEIPHPFSSSTHRDWGT